MKQQYRGFMSVDGGTTVHLWLYERNKKAFDRLYFARNNVAHRFIPINPVFRAKVSPVKPRTGFGEGLFLIEIVDTDERAWYTIAVNMRRSKTAPDLVVRINYPACRTSNTISVLYRDLIQRLFNSEIENERLSRVDVACTINDSANRIIDKILKREYVSHLRLEGVHIWGQPYETLVVGNRDWVRLNVYDKIKELKSSPGKDQKIDDILTVFSGEDEVCRVEFNLSRTLLREFNVDTVEQFNEAKFTIGAWLSKKFFRLVKKYDSSNQKLAKIDPAWRYVQQILSNNVYYVRLPRIREKFKIADIARLSATALGLMSSLVAQIPGNIEVNYKRFSLLLQYNKYKILDKAKEKRRGLCTSIL